MNTRTWPLRARPPPRPLRPLRTPLPRARYQARGHPRRAAQGRRDPPQLHLRPRPRHRRRRPHHPPGRHPLLRPRRPQAPHRPPRRRGPHRRQVVLQVRPGVPGRPGPGPFRRRETFRRRQRPCERRRRLKGQGHQVPPAPPRRPHLPPQGRARRLPRFLRRPAEKPPRHRRPPRQPPQPKTPGATPRSSPSPRATTQHLLPSTSPASAPTANKAARARPRTSSSPSKTPHHRRAHRRRRGHPGPARQRPGPRVPARRHRLQPRQVAQQRPDHRPARGQAASRRPFRQRPLQHARRQLDLRQARRLYPQVHRGQPPDVHNDEDHARRDPRQCGRADGRPGRRGSARAWASS